MPLATRSPLDAPLARFATAGLTLLLTACVPSDDTTIAGNEQNDGGISGTGYSSGPVDGFGSIYVNGIRYATADADLYINGEEWAGDEREALGVGMVVTVAGSRDSSTGTGEATEVRYRPLLRGPVTEIANLDAQGLGTLTVLDRTVTVDRGTVFADRTGEDLGGPEAITTGHAVEISGHPEGEGIRATRLSVVPASEETAIGARVTGADTDNTSLTLAGGTTVTYDDGTSIERLPEDASDWVGKTVHVRGSFSGGQLQAETITAITGLGLELPADEDGEVEASGRVTADWDQVANTFGFNGATVHLTAATEFEEGVRDSLSVGRRVELEAEYRNGTLTAEEIEFLAEPTEIAFAGAVEAVEHVDPEGRVTQLTLFGVELAVTPRTRLDLDDGDGALTAGNCIEILLQPAENADETALALQVEREDDAGCEAEIEGRVTAVENDDVTIAGVRITGITDAVQPGDRLEVEGTWANGTFQASEVEREDNEDD
jgi:hypothetical protein